MRAHSDSRPAADGLPPLARATSASKNCAISSFATPSSMRPPTEATRKITVPTPLGVDAPPETVVTVLEVAVAKESLERIGLSVGDTWVLQPDENDRLVGRGSDLLPGAVDVVGSFEAIDPDEEYWLDDTAMIRVERRRSRESAPRGEEVRRR